ncbi:3-hydroxyacyl-ACP dehydratase FabZ [Otariodibacter sp.]|uniref:3-hydroxyacyl-ACP dehydratase FabZ n=1 Tax=Otariodibacter sp. TaxID=3030919 RepID=UPI0026376E25|nr:3-hydroxyacyl-ACP dehydratase FabZ [Otariodibacter sp.]
MKNKEEKAMIDIREIMDILPHRYPFLLIDRVIEYKEGEWLKAVKNITINEPYFTGHFPSDPIFPGVLILEAMAQATGVLAIKSYGKLKENELYYFAAVDSAKFKNPVVPGDQMVIEVHFIKERRGISVFTGKAFVDGKLVCEADLKCARK